MKNIFAVCFFSMLGFTSTCALAHEPTALKGCAAKKDALETQIEKAREYNNSYQLTGLQIALRKLDANCTDESLLREREHKLREANLKVAEQQTDLRDALRQGNTKKIEKLKIKLAEAREKLQDAKIELNK